MTHYVGARLGGCLKAVRRKQDGSIESDEESEDVDVQKERYRLQDGMSFAQEHLVTGWPCSAIKNDIYKY